MRINLYAQNRHRLIIDGLPIQGFAEGDFMQVKQNGNAADISEGADGPAMNLSTKQGGEITISLLPTSPAMGSLTALRNRQASDPRMFGLVLISGVEEIITVGGCAFADLPQFTTGGPKMQPRQFVLKCLKISLDESGVEAISGGIVGGLI